MMVYLKLIWAYLKIGLFGFGGGYAMLALIERDIAGARGGLSAFGGQNRFQGADLFKAAVVARFDGQRRCLRVRRSAFFQLHSKIPVADLHVYFHRRPFVSSTRRARRFPQTDVR